MEDIIEEPIKVYVKINDKNEIVEVNSEIFIKDFTDWIEIDKGFGGKFAHAQTQYFEKPLMNNDGCYNYKLENSKLIEV